MSLAARHRWSHHGAMSTSDTPFSGTEDKQVYRGRCVGGPLDGAAASCRYPAGFVLADKPSGQAWIYDRTGEGTFAVREQDGRTLDLRRATMAAIGDVYDVIAASREGDRNGAT
jgi:hypothetical protein